MASDIYIYKGKVGKYSLTVEYIDYQDPEHMQISLVLEDEIEDEYQQDVFIELTRDQISSIKRKIVEGKIPLEYKGGYCMSGYSWGPDDVRV